jgi:adenosylmethionine-8-amino-7-oxononanoate aminotransferase
MLNPERIIWRPYTQEGLASPPLKIDRAEGAYLYTSDGQKIFDGISSWWVITHGHCHPRIVEAIQRQASRIDQIIFANFSHEPAEELSERLIGCTPPKLSRVFFTDNGSTAVESALKMALQAWEQRGFPRKKKFLAFAKAYHGDTVGAMSVSGDSLFTRPYKSTLFEILRAKQPETPTPKADECLSDFERILAEQHETIAGVIVEPLLQAAGGMIMWPKEALQKMATLCDQYGVLLIFDEVMTGFGRTGSLFAMDQIGVVPDLVCLSKGITGGVLPLAVTLVAEDIYRAFLSSDKTKMFFHGHSFTGNPIACAAAVANLHIFSEENICGRVEGIRSINAKQMSKLATKFPILNPRTCGVVSAFEIGNEGQGYKSEISERITRAGLELGLFIRPLGDTVYLLPPYCSSEADLAFAWEKIEQILERLPLH